MAKRFYPIVKEAVITTRYVTVEESYATAEEAMARSVELTESNGDFEVSWIDEEQTADTGDLVIDDECPDGMYFESYDADELMLPSDDNCIPDYTHMNPKF